MPYWLLVTKGYGFSINDINWSCPADLDPYAKAYKLQIQQQDSQMYSMGIYNKIAYEVVMAHFGAGLAGKNSKVEYIDKPFLQEVKNTNNKNKESKEEIAIFEMKQRIKTLRQQGLPESPI